MQAIDRGSYIKAMRTVASSVAVVTTDGAAGRHGATVSAFCSVSADPPTVLVCFRADSRIAQMVTRNEVFCVNILPDGSREIADRFAGAHDAQVHDRFEGIEVQGDIPEVAGATAFRCTLTKSIREASHLVCFGLVTNAKLGQQAPLTYLDGEYRKLADQRGKP